MPSEASEPVRGGGDAKCIAAGALDDGAGVGAEVGGDLLLRGPPGPGRKRESSSSDLWAKADAGERRRRTEGQAAAILRLLFSGSSFLSLKRALLQIELKVEVDSSCLIYIPEHHVLVCADLFLALTF